MERKIKGSSEINGKKIVVYQGFVGDLINAQKMAASPEEMPYCLISLLVEIDGKKLAFEDLKQMSLDEFIPLQEKVLPLLGVSQTALQSG